MFEGVFSPGGESERIGGLDEMVRDILMVASVLGIREFYWMWRLYGSGLQSTKMFSDFPPILAINGSTIRRLQMSCRYIIYNIWSYSLYGPGSIIISAL